MLRRMIAAVVSLTIVGVLAGCVGIPTSGSVTVGQNLTQRDSASFEYFPLAPATGASQEAIVRGFVAAFTGSAGDFAVARQFLTTKFAAEWNPRRSVTVRSSTERFFPIDSATMQYSVGAVASVSNVGAYRQNSSPESTSFQFHFVQQRGQWRIDQAPDGIVLSDATFRSLFDRHSLYFFDPSNTHLVPDQRWFPGGTAPLRIVSALLDGPPPWLRGAVRTAFPEGTKLATPSVDVQSGTAIVDLSPAVLAADTAERQLLQLQLSASLANVGNIRSVSVSVGGTPMVISDSLGAASRLDPQVDSRPLVLQGNSFGFLAAKDLAVLSQLSAKVVASGARAGTMASDAASVAVLGTAGVSLVRAGTAATVVLDDRPGLLAPALDNYFFVWSVVRSVPGSLRVTSVTGVASELSTGFPTEDKVVSIDVSRDGTRLAIFLNTATGTRVVVRSIIRDAATSQRPVGLGEAILDIGTATGVAVDATWVDDLSVATLENTNGTSSVMVYEVGGDRTPLGQPAPSSSLIGGNGQSGLRTVTLAGTIAARSGNGWNDTGVPVAFIATQQ